MISVVQSTKSNQRQLIDEQPNVDDNVLGLLWIDDCILKNSFNCHQTQSTFKEIFPSAKFEWDTHDAIYQILRAKYTEKKLLIVVSGQKASSLFRNLDYLDLDDHIEGIFIFCNESENYKHLQHKKLLGIYTNPNRLVEMLRAKKIVFGSIHLLSTPNPSDKDQTSWFQNVPLVTLPNIWRQLLLETLMMLPGDKQAKEDMVSKSKQYYDGDSKQMKSIKSFYREYTSALSIKWYTADSFVHKLANQALRSEDFDLLYAFRGFIGDLSIAIKELQTKQKDLYDSFVSQVKRGSAYVTNLYSAQKLTNTDFEQIKQSVGKIISINGFFSTSQDQDAAEEFIDLHMKFKDIQQILFEISFNTSSQDIASFADIQDLSEFSEEQEVLFDCDSFFIVNSVSYHDFNGIWNVKLISVPRNAIEEHPYANTLRENFIRNHSAAVAFGIIMARGFEKRDQAIQYFNRMLLNLPPDHADVPDVLQQRAILYQEQGEHTLALYDYERALQICHQRTEENLFSIISINNNIGSLHAAMSDFDASLTSYNRALSAYEQLPDTKKNSIIKAKINEHIGLTYYQSGNTSKALEYLNNVFLTYKELLPEKHLWRFEILGHLGTIYKATGDWTSAAKCFHCQLNWGQSMLPLDHPLRNILLGSVFHTYMKANQTSNFSQIFNQHIEILNRKFVKQDSTIPNLLFTVASFLQSSHPDEAIKFYEKSIEFGESSTQIGRSLILKCHKNLAQIYKNTRNLNLALGHALDVHSLVQEVIPEEDYYAHEADAAYDVGLIYLEMGLPMEALSYLTKASISYELAYTLHHPETKAALKSVIDAVNLSQSISLECVA